ncbi:MAG: hypothetical protein SLRJCFUN_001141 [Candidatus Fervidibacter sp.]
MKSAEKCPRCALLQGGGDTDRALRLALLTSQPFLNRFRLVTLRTPQALILTPFLIATEGLSSRERRHQPATSAAHLPLGALLKEIDRAVRHKNLRQAERLAQIAVRHRPNAQTFFTLGNVWLRQERWLEAACAFQAALGEAPGFFAAANNLAWVYLKLAERWAQHPGGEEEATLFLHQADHWANYALERAPQDAPTLAHILDTAGWVDFLLGRTRGSRPQVRWRLKRALKRLR